jgi:putative transposase
VEQRSQFWCTYITDLPMRTRILYLISIMDSLIRKVRALGISNALEANFCVEALNEAIHKIGLAEIMNIGHGAHSHPSPRLTR